MKPANSDKPIVVVIPCPDCGATGLYHGYVETPGVAVPCWTCKGSAEKIVTLKPFKGRQTRTDIQTVLYRRDSGDITITYEQFLAGDIPPDEK